MIAIIRIKIKKIKNTIITDEVIESNPELIEVTRKTMEKIEESLKKYLKDYKIIVETESEVYIDDD